MRVLHVVRQFYPCIGGVENFVLNLAIKQKELGYNVSVLTLNKNFASSQRLPADSIVYGIKVTRIPFFGIRRYPVALSCIKYLSKVDFVHVHCVDFFIDFLCLTKIFHKNRLILSTHGGIFHTKWLLPFKKMYFNLITKQALKSCDTILASSPQDYRMFSVISKKTRLVSNGVDIEKFSSIRKNIEFGRCLYVGRLDKHKQIDMLLRVLFVLRNAGIDVKLRIVGPDWCGNKDELMRLCKELSLQNAVSFLGVLSDEQLISEYSRAHLFLSASAYEGFGIAAVEAMASGTVCILNDIAAYKEFVNSGSNGYLVSFQEERMPSECIATALKLNDCDYSAMAYEGKMSVQRFSWSKVAADINALYKKI